MAAGLVGLTLVLVDGRGQGFDTGQGAPALAGKLAGDLAKAGTKGLWLRVRGVPDPAGAKPEEVAEHRAALERLHREGFNLCVLLMPSAASWAKGVRAQPLARIPLDLREAFDWMQRLQRAYGDVVDRWEIDNEPDIQFVVENPETYTAYLKACTLGARAGAMAPAGDFDHGLHGGHGWTDPGGLGQVSGLSAQVPFSSGSVLMGALAMPPGPYLERFIANGGLGYTDGFNYHYYGYAADFTGVYRQFEKAVSVLSSKAATGAATAKPDFPNSVHETLGEKTLPVFLTEYGFGILSGEAAETIEGRVRQWDWFRDVGTQARRLRIEGAMAFLAMPYLEYGAKEYGLTAHAGDVRSGERKGGGADGATKPDRDVFWAGGLGYRANDFGETTVRPWMKRIGREVAGHEATPAMAWLLADAAKARKPSRGWTIKTAEPSAVVIDFVAGTGLTQTKPNQGYFLTREAADAKSDHGHGRQGGKESTGEGELRVYNFGHEPATGRLEIGAVAAPESMGVRELTLAPGEMRVMPVKLRVGSGTLRPNEWAVRFAPNAPAAESTFSTRLYGTPRPTTRVVLSSLSAQAAGPRNAHLLARRGSVTGEPPETAAGGWSTTRGVQVSERDGVWSFAIDKLPAEPTRPAFAELILPDDFRIPEDGVLSLEYRVVPGAAAAGSPAEPTDAGRSPLFSNAMGIYWRTANGSLFTVWRPPPATAAWQRYSQLTASFTMAFYGRAKGPWRLMENQPVALVLTFLPGALPATFQVRKAEIVGY